jgi:hypothetical protein
MVLLHDQLERALLRIERLAVQHVGYEDAAGMKGGFDLRQGEHDLVLVRAHGHDVLRALPFTPVASGAPTFRINSTSGTPV